MDNAESEPGQPLPLSELAALIGRQGGRVTSAAKRRAARANARIGARNGNRGPKTLAWHVGHQAAEAMIAQGNIRRAAKWNADAAQKDASLSGGADGLRDWRLSLGLTRLTRQGKPPAVDLRKARDQYNRGVKAALAKHAAATKRVSKN